MNTFIIARVILMPDGSIHIAHMNKQTYYCTAEALLLLITDTTNFLLKGYGRLSTSTLVVNKKQESVEAVRGLTLLTVNSNSQIVCEFLVLFQVFLSALSDPVRAKMCLQITGEMLQGCEDYYNNSAIRLYFEHCQLSRHIKTNNNKNNACCSQPNTRMLEEILNFPECAVSRLVESKTEPCDDMSLNEQFEITEVKEATHNQQDVPTSKQYVTVAEFAKVHGYKVNTVNNWVWKGKLSSAYKDDKNKWWVDINDTTKDGRANRKIIPLSDGRKRICLRGTDYDSVQKFIKERNLVTNNVRPFIRTKEEVKYYETHSYHEVSWETGNALIIDINPDYFSKKYKKSNRQLIADNKSPVVPENEDYEYVLHHIGQNKDSPLAIIPGNDHGDRKWFSVFHVGKTCSDELHGQDFEKQKRLFWNEYIKMYDQNGGYRGIKYLNPKHKRKVIQ